MLSDITSSSLLNYLMQLKHSDGRTNFPLLFIYWSPSTAKAEVHMLVSTEITHCIIHYSYRILI
jgi:hypothetical protein